MLIKKRDGAPQDASDGYDKEKTYAYFPYFISG